jgi:hypothetical protein
MGSGGSTVTPACTEAQARYDADRDDFAKISGAIGCTADSDCTAVAEPGPCGTGCGIIPLRTFMVDAVETVLMSDATVCEGVCPARAPTPCPAGQLPVCRGGKCTLGGDTGAAGAVGSSGDDGTRGCDGAQARYAMDRGAYIEKYSMTPCTLDTDCRLVIETNNCDTSCFSALPVTVAGLYESNISSDAAACNAECPAPPRPPCVPQVALCSNGTCTSVNARGGSGPP